MIIIAIIQVKNFEALKKFELSVSPILQSMGARILHAFETQHRTDGSGEEVHVLFFPNQESFEKYKAETAHPEIVERRQAAISQIELKIEKSPKSYNLPME